ncbi:hypothetical protein CCACVL1_04367 [Corchorus capsularis]|uniref:Uncharacterized protein n=1 Tax=Corchorus capsularis TaxID=210143 RepID=A0A1R3JT52_COCAP|nr:hypothetical protein CCACVL1_04367 [Corchorus capsularis]
MNPATSRLSGALVQATRFISVLFDSRLLHHRSSRCRCAYTYTYRLAVVAN